MASLSVLLLRLLFITKILNFQIWGVIESYIFKERDYHRKITILISYKSALTTVLPSMQIYLFNLFKLKEEELETLKSWE